MNSNEAKMFIRNSENIIKLFGEEAFAKAAESFKVEDFSTFEFVPLDQTGRIAYFEKMGYPLLADKITHSFEEYKGNTDFHRSVNKLSNEYRVPDQYQNKECKLLKMMLWAAKPYLSTFELDVYHCDKENAEFYIRSESGSLYVPFAAVLNNDWAAIEERMTSYFNRYYAGPGKEEYKKKALEALVSPTALRLKSYMESGMSEPTAEDLAAYAAKHKEARKYITAANKDRKVQRLQFMVNEFAGLNGWWGYKEADNAVVLMRNLVEAIKALPETEA